MQRYILVASFVTYHFSFAFLSETVSLKDFSFKKGEYTIAKSFDDRLYLIGKNNYIEYATGKIFDYSKPIDPAFKQLDLEKYLTVSISPNIYFIEPSGGGVYEFDFQTVKRLDNSEINKAYHDTRAFVYNGEIFLVGGYGYWEHRSQLIKYNFNNQKWELVTNLLSENYGFVEPKIVINKNNLYVFSAKLYNSFLGNFSPNKFIIHYNFKNQNIEKIKFNYSDHSIIAEADNSRNYITSYRIGFFLYNEVNKAIEYDPESLTHFKVEYLNPLISDSNPVRIKDTLYSLVLNKNNEDQLFLIKNPALKTQDLGSFYPFPINEFLVISGISLTTLGLFYFYGFKNSSYTLEKKQIRKGVISVKIDYDEFYFLNKLALKQKVENQDLISYFDRDGKSYDLNVKRKNAMVSKLSYKINSTFKNDLFKKIASPNDKRQGQYVLNSKLRLSQKI